MEKIKIISKLNEIMGLTERFAIANQADLAKNRSKMIDMGTIALLSFEDDFFTYDQLKALVTKMIDHYLQGQHFWHIDIQSCTEDSVTVINDETQRSITLPTGIFMATLPISANRAYH